MIDNVKLERLKSERKRLEGLITNSKSNEMKNELIVQEAIEELHDINNQIEIVEKASSKFLKVFENKRAHINYAKSELKQYMFLLGVCHELQDKILVILTQLKGVKSPGTTVIISNGNGESKEVKAQALRDKLQEYQKEYATTRHRTDKIEDFLDNLSDQDRKIVTKIYINSKREDKLTMEVLARRLGGSEKTLRRSIDEIMINF
ncbi:hypothetical protein [Erysipelothrix anatis]|uniref:hypothetical protein n=1 Tax=Erysipelothrix anatis TaxID=2683713 RepID=UPI001357CBBD|nr:hypothetical protein [Erysipelothrix anatis]